MGNIKLHFIIGTILLLSSCRETNKISEDQKIAISEAIKERVNGYAEAVKRHDADWLLNFWSNEIWFLRKVYRRASPEKHIYSRCVRRGSPCSCFYLAKQIISY